MVAEGVEEMEEVEEVEEEEELEVSNFLHLFCCYDIVVIIITLCTKSIASKGLNYGHIAMATVLKWRPYLKR